MDFSSFNTDDLLAALPVGDEDDRWELKSAIYLDPAKRNEFKKELGKQVSAFANSGGGYLVFGVSKTRDVEPCPLVVGRQTMKDYLASMTEQSVEYPIRAFKIHPIPLKSNPDEYVFVVAIDDSPAAPHQAKEEKHYYYRIDGHSKPAPHFHIELLRSRYTKAVLRIVEADFFVSSVTTLERMPKVCITLHILVENQSHQSATNWGVILREHEKNRIWTSKGRYLSNGEICFHGEQKVVLPTERAGIVIHLEGIGRTAGPNQWQRLWEAFGFVLRCVSQNHVGEDYPVGIAADETEARNSLLWFEDQLTKFEVRF
jgi:hypothetical protein